MPDEQPHNPLHGVTLKAIVESLVEHYGWEQLGEQIPIRCFQQEPSVKSSLKFLRKTEWARKRVEDLYLADARKAARNRKRNQRRADRRSLKEAYDAIQERDAIEDADTEESRS